MAPARGRPRSRMPPLRTLQPLLLVVLFVFVGIPMLVYNFSSLDFSRFPEWQQQLRIGISDGSPAVEAAWEPGPISPLPRDLAPCFNVSSAALQTPADLMAIVKQCFTPGPTLTQPADLVHMIYVPVHAVPLFDGETPPPKENFTIAHFVAFQSIRKFIKPRMMILHYPATEPRSYWYTQCQRYLSLYRVLFPKTPKAGRSSLNIYQRRELFQFLLMLRALRKQGGIAFGDFSTFVLWSFHQWKRFALFAGRTQKKSFSISTHLMQATAGHAFVAFLESKLQDMYENDDIRLRSMPLDRLIGDLTIEKYGTSPLSSVNAVIASPEVLDGVPLHQLQGFITARIDAHPVDLHHTTAFHLDNYDYSRNSIDHSGISSLLLALNRIANDEVLREDATLFGAILRYTMSWNSTAELDEHLQRPPP